jgi:hypothetical protein
LFQAFDAVVDATRAVAVTIWEKCFCWW